MADRPLPRRISSNKPIAGRAHVDYFVRPVTNLDELRSTLQPHRAYAAYALGQLQPQLFARSEWWLAHGAQGQALVLHSKGGLGHALFALGAIDALQAVLQLHPGPRHTFLSCQVQHLETMLRYYHLPEQQSMMRMLVDSETLQPAEGNTRGLTGRDVHTSNRLYRSEGTPAFYSAENSDAAVHYGAYDGGSLAAGGGRTDGRGGAAGGRRGGGGRRATCGAGTGRSRSRRARTSSATTGTCATPPAAAQAAPASRRAAPRGRARCRGCVRRG